MDSFAIRESIIINSNCDIISINETFLRDNETLDIHNYRWIGRNRTNINPRALRGSGGVGFLIKKEVELMYKIDITDT